MVTVSRDLGSNPTLTIYGPASGVNTFTNITSQFSTWHTTQGVTKVTLLITEPGSSFTYTLVGLPSAGISNATTTPTTIPTTNNDCNFANPGTGTYANQLCFVDFSGFNNTTYSASNPN